MKIVIIAVLAGALAFFWSAVSWMALPFHDKTLYSFNYEPVVAKTLKTGAHKAGIYTVPGPVSHSGDLSKEEKEAAWEESARKMEKGPFAFVAIVPGGMKYNMTLSMAIGFLKDVLAAFLFIWLLAQTKISSYIMRVAFVVMAALAGGIICILPNWIWWAFPMDFILLTFADIAIAWFLAGLVIAKS